MKSLEDMKEELQDIQADIKKRTDKFNLLIQKLKDKEKSLLSEIKNQESLEKAEQFQSIEILCSQAGMTIEEIKRMIAEKVKNNQ